MSKITCDSVDLHIENVGYQRSLGNGISSEAHAVVRLTLDNGEDRICILLDAEARRCLSDELRFGDATRVPPELNELREQLLQERKEKGR